MDDELKKLQDALWKSISRLEIEIRNIKKEIQFDRYFLVALGFVISFFLFLS